MKIKPVLTIIDGKVETFDKIRTFNKAISKVMDLYFEETKGLNVVPFVIHANNPTTRDLIIEKLKENDPSITKVDDMPLTAVVGAHAGPKTIGLGYYIQR